MKIQKIVSVVSGVDLMLRLWGTLRSVWRQASAVTRAIANGIQEKLDPDEARQAKYRVYSHVKKRSFYSDDFGAVLRATYSEADIQAMKRSARISRRIQAWGAVIIYVLSTLEAFRMLSIVPLLSIFPAMLLMAFALRHACREESLKRGTLVDPIDFLRLQGTFGLWK